MIAISISKLWIDFSAFDIDITALVAAMEKANSIVLCISISKLTYSHKAHRVASEQMNRTKKNGSSELEAKNQK